MAFEGLELLRREATVAKSCETEATVAESSDSRRGDAYHLEVSMAALRSLKFAPQTNDARVGVHGVAVGTGTEGAM